MVMIVMISEGTRKPLKFIQGAFIMEQRINSFEKAGGALKAMFALSGYLAKSTIEKKLQHLVEFRVSQINGCAYCLDMHSKDLRAEGETEQRLYMISAWRESPVYSDRER